MPQTTSKDVAKLAGVSRSTVSLVLNNSNMPISEETRQKVLKAAKELNYQPNMLAQSLKTNRSKIIGLIIPSITNPFFPSIAQGVEEIAVENGYNTFLCNTFKDPIKEENYIKALTSKQVDGIIFASSIQNPHILKELQKRKIAFITFDQSTNNDCILFDNVKGSEMAVDYLFSLGHKNIGFISTSITTPSHIDRLEGYKKAHEKAGIPLNPKYIREDKYINKTNLKTNYEQNIGGKLASELLEQCPEVTAIFAINDLIAIGVIKLKQSGLRIPEDISVIGFDDIYMSGMVDPPLTTIRQPTYKMGQRAAEFLISKMSGEENEDEPKYMMIYSPELIIRDSCVKRQNTD
jgi:LacI family transcriptional regulator